jgi:hypothetical protein
MRLIVKGQADALAAPGKLDIIAGFSRIGRIELPGAIARMAK